MKKGLLVSIYDSKDLGNCSNHGISATHSKAVLTGPGIPEIFKPHDDAPEVELHTGNLGHGFKAVPAKHGAGIGPMFGGAFIYSSDSRFPSKQPIALHDRWESAELNEMLSR